MTLARSLALAGLCLTPGLLPVAASADHCTRTITAIDGTAPCVLALHETTIGPTGAKHIRVTPAATPAPGSDFAVGDTFPIYDHNMLIDPPRYGLPAVTGNWRYYRAEGVTYRVDAATHAVLEVMDVTGLALLD